MSSLRLIWYWRWELYLLMDPSTRQRAGNWRSLLLARIAVGTGSIMTLAGCTLLSHVVSRPPQAATSLKRGIRDLIHWAARCIGPAWQLAAKLHRRATWSVSPAWGHGLLP